MFLSDQLRESSRRFVRLFSEEIVQKLDELIGLRDGSEMNRRRRMVRRKEMLMNGQRRLRLFQLRMSILVQRVKIILELIGMLKKQPFIDHALRQDDLVVFLVDRIDPLNEFHITFLQQIIAEVFFVDRSRQFTRTRVFLAQIFDQTLPIGSNQFI